MSNTLGDFIKKKRGETSLRDFAKLCEISHTHLDSLEKGYDPRTGKSISPTIDVLGKIARGIGMSLGDFLIQTGVIADEPFSSPNKISEVSNNESFDNILFLQKLKNLSPEKRKAIEILMESDTQKASTSKN